MTIWIVAGLVGGLLSLVAFVVLLRKFRLGEISGRYLLAAGVGYVAFVSYALMSALRPNALSSALTLLMLLPAFVAIVLIVGEHRRRGMADRPTSRKGPA